MSTTLRFASCNEVFGRLPFAASCRILREAGYGGIEIAPFTLAENPVLLTAGERAAIRQTIVQEKLAFVGLHWLLASPPGLHATTPDLARRRHTWEFIGDLVDLCADLRAEESSRPVLVFGSPKQRNAAEGMAPAQAIEVFAEEAGRLAPRCEDRGVVLLVEALSPGQSDVITRLEDAVRIVEQIGSPAVQTMFDVHNAAGETVSHSDLLKTYWRYIRHVHVNEMDGQEPGRGDYDFGSLLAVLDKLNYEGWVSLESFDFTREPSSIVKGALDHLRSRAPLSLASTAD